MANLPTTGTQMITVDLVKKIYDYIRKNPGSTVRDYEEQLGISTILINSILGGPTVEAKRLREGGFICAPIRGRLARWMEMPNVKLAERPFDYKMSAYKTETSLEAFIHPEIHSEAVDIIESIAQLGRRAKLSPKGRKKRVDELVLKTKAAAYRSQNAFNNEQRALKALATSERALEVERELYQLRMANAILPIAAG